MFDWVTDIVEAIGGTVSETVASMGEAIAESIFGAFLQWIYEIVFGAIADFFTYVTSMGAELFDLDWVKAVILLFTTFGWALFVAGVIVAVFDTAIEYQNGRANIKSTAINILKGFFACSLIGVVPVELYKLCITLQNTFAHDLASLAGANAARDIGQLCSDVMKIYFDMKTGSLHVSLFIGDGYVIQAANTKKGVIKTPLSYNSWTHWLKIPYITYIEEETTSEPTTEIL